MAFTWFIFGVCLLFSQPPTARCQTYFVPCADDCTCYKSGSGSSLQHNVSCILTKSGLPTDLPTEKTEHLKLFCNDHQVTIKAKANLFASFTDLLSLKVVGCFQKRIPYGTFAGLSKLKTLYINECWNLTDLAPGIFNDTPNIVTLDLKKNKLAKIRKKTFANLTNLETIDLKQNEIDEIKPRSFVGLKKLKELYLNENRLKRVNINAFGMLKDWNETKVSFKKNPMICDCHLVPIWKWLIGDAFDKPNWYLNQANKCGEGNYMKGWYWGELTEETLKTKCPSITSTTTTTKTTTSTTTTTTTTQKVTEPTAIASTTSEKAVQTNGTQTTGKTSTKKTTSTTVRPKRKPKFKKPSLWFLLALIPPIVVLMFLTGRCVRLWFLSQVGRDLVRNRFTENI